MTKEEVIKRNNVKIFGKGKQPILFAHGFGCDQVMWRYVTPAFESDYLIVLFDYVGSGYSDLKAYNKEKYNSLNGYARDILDICEALHLKDAILILHSVSSMIGLLAAVQKSKYFSNLIMIGPSPRYINDGAYKGGFEKSEIEGLLETMEKNYIGWANFLAPVVMKNPDRPELTAELYESFCATDPDVAKQFAEVTFYSDNRRDLNKLKLPVLILQCSEDLIAPETVGQYVHEHIAGSTFKHLKATGHCPHVSHPEETVEAIKEYLK